MLRSARTLSRRMLVPTTARNHAQRLPDRLLRDCRCRCCLTILVSGSAAAVGSGSDRPLPNLRSMPPPLETGLCPFAELLAPEAGFAGCAGLLPAAPDPDPLLSEAGLVPPALVLPPAGPLLFRQRWSCRRQHRSCCRQRR